MVENEKVFLGDSIKKEVLLKDKDFADRINHYKQEGLVFDFGEEEWDRIKNQNFPDMPGGFMEVFEKGINRGNCGATVKRLSYSYNNVNIVKGKLPVLKGTIASPEGGHSWLEDDNYIYDTTLLLKIDKRVKKELGYVDEVILTSYDLCKDPLYMARKSYVNDLDIRKKH